MLILDDINGLASASAFAHWIKSVVDEIATSDTKLPLSLILVGIEERRQSLISLNPSLARVFDFIEIAPWSKSETETFFGQAFSSVSVHCTPDATTTLTQFAGGLPVLAHEIGDAVFKVDSDDRIDRDDALLGVLAAADVVGRKYLESRVFQEIRSKRYRTILRKIAAEERGETFKCSDILGRLTSGETKVFDNFLKKMKDIGVLRYDKEAGCGAYRFQNLLHHLYFRLEAERATEQPAD